MAKLRAGILGNIRGKVAGVVGSQWKDKNYVREYVKPANPNTAAQIVQRTLMQGAVAFAKNLVGPVFNAYTDRFQKSMSGFNYFIKKNITEFVAVPTWTDIVLTEGKLSSVLCTAPTYDNGNGEAVINWAENLGNNGADDDKVSWAIYDKSTGLFYFSDGEIDRDAQFDSQTLPTGLTATNLYCWTYVAQYKGTLVDLIGNSTVLVMAAP